MKAILVGEDISTPRGLILFIVVPCLFLITFKFLSPKKHSLLKYRMLQLTFKLSPCGLLHVSVRSDHHQGAYAETC